MDTMCGFGSGVPGVRSSLHCCIRFTLNPPGSGARGLGRALTLPWTRLRICCCDGLICLSALTTSMRMGGCT